MSTRTKRSMPSGMGAGTYLGLQLLLALADPCNLGMRVQYGRNTVVVNVRMPSNDALDADDPLVLGLVRQHRSVHHVADGEDAVITRMASEQVHSYA